MQKNEKRTIIFLTALLIIMCMPQISAAAKQGLKNVDRFFIRKKIMASCKGFKTETNKYASIYYSEKDSEYISTVKSAVDLYYPLLCADFGFSASPKTVIVIYPSAQHLAQNITGADEKTAMGAYYGGIINILSPRLINNNSTEMSNKIFFIDNGPIVHELAHHLLDEKTGGNYEPWFSEGVALYFEYKYTAYEWRADLKEKSSALTLTQLRNNFGEISKPFAYRKAFDIVNNIVREAGEDSLMDFAQGFFRAAKL
jgi:hypothetical protein